MKKATKPPSKSLKRVPLSEILGALSDPARLEIVKVLLKKEELCCGQFDSGVCKSTMSHHFKVLKEAGIIKRRDEGTRQFNSLRRDDLEARCPGLLQVLEKSLGPF